MSQWSADDCEKVGSTDCWRGGLQPARRGGRLKPAPPGYRLSTTIGSIRLARQAGIIVATSATTTRAAVPAPSTIGFIGATLKSWLFINSPTPYELASPTATPMPTIFRPSRSTRLNTPAAVPQFARRHGVKGFTVESQAEALSLLNVLDLPVMLQESIPGPPTSHFFVEGFRDRTGASSRPSGSSTPPHVPARSRQQQPHAARSA